jgi:hypothetical protein
MTSKICLASCKWLLVFSSMLFLSACGGGSSKGLATSAAGAPVVYGLTPTKAVAGVATTFTASGANLTLTPAVVLAGGSCNTPTNTSTTGFTVVCTPGSAVGDSVATVYTKTLASGGWWMGTATIAVSATPVVTGLSLLPDTGITTNQCYAAGSNAFFSCSGADAIALNDKQDGMLGRDVISPDSSDGLLGSNYRLVGAVGSSDCVKDEVTGNTWQRTSSTLVNVLANPLLQEANGLRDAANNAALCGYTDWTLPSPFDLQSLVNYGVVNSLAAIDGNWFAPKSGSYFTGIPYVRPGFVEYWMVDFKGGGVSIHTNELRLIRKTTPVVNRFSYSSDGSEVNDAQTGLVWLRCSAGQTWDKTTFACTGSPLALTHENALAYAQTKTGWRMPNAKELASLFDTGKAPFIDIGAFPGTTASSNLVYWTNTPYVQSPASAWVVSFLSGTVSPSARSGSNFMYLVR